MSNGQRSSAVCLQEGNVNEDGDEIISITAERTGQITEFMLRPDVFWLTVRHRGFKKKQ